MEEEQWLPVIDWPEYAVSSLGNIKRVTASRGAVIGRILIPHIYPRTGYKFVTLYRSCKGKMYLIHRLVALAFLGQPPTPKHQCNHKNGNKLDNRPKNLEWVTHKENAQHSYRLGLTQKPPTLRGESSTSCKITEQTAQAILDAPRGYGTGIALARKFGITTPHVSTIRTRHSWKHLTPRQ